LTAYALESRVGWAPARREQTNELEMPGQVNEVVVNCVSYQAELLINVLKVFLSLIGFYLKPWCHVKIKLF